MARRRKRREDDEPSYWLSYSDMMAGLLLMFVIIISFTMMQSRIQFEQDEKELKEQKATLIAQQQKLDEQNTAMDEQNVTLSEQEALLAEQQATLDEQQATLDEQQAQLEEAQVALETQQATVAAQESQLEEAQTTLTTQQTQLEEAQTALTEQQTQLEEAQTALATQQTQLEEAQTALADQQTQLEEAQSTLASQREQIETQRQQMADLVGVRSELIAALREAFEGTAGVAVDSKTGSIMFESSILFAFSDDQLSEEGETFLKEFLPQYFRVLLSDEFRDYVSEIIIEGHTDNVGDYIYNMELSQRRALAVAAYCLNEESGVLTSDMTAELQGIVTANGRSYSDLIYNDDGTVDQEASRRVVFKFRLKDEEMVDQMISLLNGTAEDGTAAEAEDGTEVVG